MAIITISRQIRSGGDEIATRLAKELLFTLADHILLAEPVKGQGFSTSDVEALDEEEVGGARQNREQDRVYVDLLPALMER
jgi:Cytidylate kinase-like family